LQPPRRATGGVLGSGSRHRPCPRSRNARRAGRGLARGAPSPKWRRALGSRTGRGSGRMTFAEARARFPVLERYAYLNAGTSGPLARQTAEAVASQQAADLEEGRAGKAYHERGLGLRTRLRELLAGLLNVDSDRIALTASTTDGCNIVLAGLD